MWRAEEPVVHVHQKRRMGAAPGMATDPPLTAMKELRSAPAGAGCLSVLVDRQQREQQSWGPAESVAVIGW
jgi:hypothetical protein